MSCAIAGDATLAGNPAVALNIRYGMTVGELEGLYGSHFDAVSGPGEVGTILKGMGNGTRGIVYGEWNDENGDYEGSHAWNAVNENGKIRYPDFQNEGEDADWGVTTPIISCSRRLHE